jgi:2-iminobutanoate/2-iminopropanoate deaminase
MHAVQAEHAPQPLGHYGHAMVHGGLVFVSGQLPIDPASGVMAGDSIEEQMEQALANVAAILAASGSGLDRILKVTIYIADMGLSGRANAVYARILGEHRPARAMVPVLPLPQGCLVEIEAIAALGDAD